MKLASHPARTGDLPQGLGTIPASVGNTPHARGSTSQPRRTYFWTSETRLLLDQRSPRTDGDPHANPEHKMGWPRGTPHARGSTVEGNFRSRHDLGNPERTGVYPFNVLQYNP